jgi:hypothetical protein
VLTFGVNNTGNGGEASQLAANASLAGISIHSLRSSTWRATSSSAIRCPRLVDVGGSLTVSALPVGEQPDDDFLSAGTDHSGFDGPNRAADGAPFDATLR